MGSMPLHPAIVHPPLGLAILMPLVAAGFVSTAKTASDDESGS